ncbi:MAG TPA: glycosyltransferase family 39 protein [Tepidisphaeraceae bacterium]|nr:glycosyltransferase family 39 protein [Tepidisphaeraceae bacterium]
MPELVDKATIELSTTGARLRAKTIAAAATLVLAMAVNLPIRGWLSASNPLERVNMETVAEMQRSGKWFFPTLNEQPRLAKPPIAAWLSAMSTSRSTIERMNDDDATVRHAALLRLLGDVRVPAVIAASLMLVAIFDLGVTLGSFRTGVLAALIAGTTLMFLRQAVVATSDVYLALSVAAANSALARIVLGRGRPMTWLAAGSLLGLGIMCKGPVSLLETVFPAGLFVLWRRRRPGGFTTRRALAAGLAMLAIGGWWFCLAMLHYGREAVDIWTIQVFRYQTNLWQADPWYSYIIALRLFLPWLPWLLVGFWNAVGFGRTDERRWLAIFLLVAPGLVLSLFHERRDRYLLPMLAPAAVIMAQGLIDWIDDPRRKSLGGTALLWLHWGLMLAGVIVVWRSLAQHHPIAAGGTACGGMFVLAGWLLTYRRPEFLAPITAALVIWFNAAFLFGQEKGVPVTLASRMADVIHAQNLRGDVCVLYPEPTTMYVPAVDLSLWLGRPVRLIQTLPNAEGLLVYTEGLRTSPPPETSSWHVPFSRLDDGTMNAMLFVSSPPSAPKD